MKLTIDTIERSIETMPPRTEYLAIVRGEGHKALGEGQNERAAVMDGLNSYFTAKQNAETVAKNEATLPSFELTFDNVVFDRYADNANRVADLLNSARETSVSATFEVPGPIISNRVATDSLAIGELMEEAAKDDLLVDIIYEKENGDRSERRIHPTKVEDRSERYGALSGPSSTYVLAIDQRSGELRTFRLDRFDRAEIVG